MSRRPVRFADLGSWSYQRAWDFQESIFTEVVDRKSANRKLPEEERIEFFQIHFFYHKLIIL